MAKKAKSKSAPSKTKKEKKVASSNKKTVKTTLVKKRKTVAEKLVAAIVFGMEEKKGNEIIALDLRDTGNTVADYFIICHGNSKVQVEALADSVEEQVKKIIGEAPMHVEGKQNSTWILLDYFNVVAHIFEKEVREFYNIENLWADANILKSAAV